MANPQIQISREKAQILVEGAIAFARKGRRTRERFDWHIHYHADFEKNGLCAILNDCINSDWDGYIEVTSNGAQVLYAKVDHDGKGDADVNIPSVNMRRFYRVVSYIPGDWENALVRESSTKLL